MAFVASVLIRKFTHIGNTNNNTSTLPERYLLKIYAIGYPNTRQRAVVITPTRSEVSRTCKLAPSFIRAAKLPKVKLLFASRKAYTKTSTSGITTNNKRNKIYG